MYKDRNYVDVIMFIKVNLTKIKKNIDAVLFFIFSLVGIYVRGLPKIYEFKVNCTNIFLDFIIIILYNFVNTK